MVTRIHFDGPEDLPPEDIIAPAWYVNGFPKSGTHLAAAMLRPFARPMPPDKFTKSGWATSFAFNGWTNDWLNIRHLLHALCGCRNGYYHIGHCGYKEEIERTLFYNGTAMVFIYRDLRDVAVSHVHHILSDDARFRHHHKDDYCNLGGFDEVLEAVICGLQVTGGQWGDVYYPGTMERWEMYAPWLKVDWVHSVEYSAVLSDPMKAARGIVTYGMRRLTDIFDQEQIDLGHTLDAVAEAMVANAMNQDKSPTFRKGVTGEWRERFTKKHKDLFKTSDVNGWLVRLGFEINDKW